MQHILNRRLIPIFIAILFLVIGCSIHPETEYPASATKTLETGSNIQPSPSATATVTSNFTSTTSPTLSPTQIVEGVRQMYENNGGCELPCLWGIVPGKTRFQDLQEGLGQLGTFEDVTRSTDYFQTVSFKVAVTAPDDLIGTYDDERWSFGFSLENDVVVGIFTGIGPIEKFSQPSLAGFLSYFGRPEEIRIEVIPDPSDLPDYAIALYYPSKGIFINWRGTADSVINENEKGIEITTCPQYIPTLADTMIGSYPPYFYLFSPDPQIPFDEISTKHLALEPSYHLLDDTSVDKFYNTYLDPSTQVCLPFSYP